MDKLFNRQINKLVVTLNEYGRILNNEKLMTITDNNIFESIEHSHIACLGNNTKALEVVAYGDCDDICLECIECNEVLFSMETYLQDIV